MARKTTGTTTRSKKSAVSVPPATVEVAAEVRKEVRKNGKAANQTAAMAAPVNLEEEIRRRAYELYLQRRATAGAESGDENQDWLVAEREIRSRQGGQEQHSA
jgi:Protein of unknown function (DUF2934)